LIICGEWKSVKNAPRKPMVLAIIAIFVLISPIYAESASNLEKYLDCSSEKKIDIAFVFDTTNSMGGEISELRATANKFATDLDASNIDYQLGLVEFRDFPETCDGFSCGSPGDYAYSVKGNGTLTSEIDTFGSWLKELKAGGGGSPGPEAVLAALRHAGSDLSWRIDAEKAIIVLTDAGAHPDGSCCNAEGDTLEGTIFELVDIGARAYIIGPEDASLEKIAENTGGQFYEIRSGLSLKPLLEEITKSLGCSFRTDVATECENNKLEVSVQLIGKETIPYISGQTEAWMYLDQAGSISRFNLSYDQETEAYLGSVPDVCGPVELTVYGSVGERGAVHTVLIECQSCVSGLETEEQEKSNKPPKVISLVPDQESPNEYGAEIEWTAEARDPDGDQILYKFFLNDVEVTKWETQNNWTWMAPEAGSYRIEVQIRDGKHAQESGMDDRKTSRFEISGTYRPPTDDSLVTDETKSSTTSLEKLAFSPDGRILAMACGNGTINLMDVASGTLIRTLEGRTDPENFNDYVVNIAFSPDGKTLASVFGEGMIKLWNIADGNLTLTHILEGHTYTLTDGVFSPDGKTLASGSWGDPIRLWDVASGDLMRTFNNEGSVVSIAFSHDGQTLALNDWLGERIELQDVATGDPICTLKGDYDNIRLAFSLDDETIAGGDMEGQVRLWDVASGDLIRTLEGHTDTVMGVAFSPDGQTLASGSLDSTVILWDVATGELIRKLEGHTDEVNDIAFNPNGQTLASGGRDGSIRIWRVE